jgi:L-lactate dehydrogenase (cytochrome)
MEVLHELAERRPDLVRNPEFAIFLDGGVTRGTDVLKALCLGARAVGLGRAFLYANGVWGEQGCDRVIQSESSYISKTKMLTRHQVMKEEIVTGMRLLGVRKIEELGPHLVRYVDRDPLPRRSVMDWKQGS